MTPIEELTEFARDQFENMFGVKPAPNVSLDVVLRAAAIDYPSVESWFCRLHHDIFDGHTVYESRDGECKIKGFDFFGLTKEETDAILDEGGYEDLQSRLIDYAIENQTCLHWSELE